MSSNVSEKLNLSDEIEEYLVSTFMNLSVDDSNNSDILLEDKWVVERFVEAELINSSILENVAYPLRVHEYVVTSQEKAINFDNIATSYNATMKERDIFRTNECVGSTDALYIKGDNEKSTWYLIEFKNGDWDYNGIRDKIYDSITLLNNINELDKHCIIKNNREKTRIAIENLNISDNLIKHYGFEATAKFYKEHVKMIVVSSGTKHIAKEYKKLCDLRDFYKEINDILLSMDLKLKKAKKYNFNFGYDTINNLANLLITSNSANNAKIKYDSIMKMLDRVLLKKSQQLLNVFNKSYELNEYLFDKFYNSNKIVSQYKENICNGKKINSDSMIHIFARGALKNISYENTLGYKDNLKDDYEFLESICDIYNLSSKDKRKIQKKINDIINKCDGIVCDRQSVQVIFSEEFFDLDKLIENNNFDELVKRVIFIEKILSQKSSGLIEMQSIEKLLINIVNMNEQKASMLARVELKDMKEIYDCVALWQYLYGDISTEDSVRNDNYMKLIQQAKLIYMLSNNKEIYGGVFHSRIENAVNKCKEEDKRLARDKEVKVIKELLEDGTDIKNILPLQIAINMTVDKNFENIKRLKTMFKGSVLKDVDYCYGIDFNTKLRDL